MFTLSQTGLEKAVGEGCLVINSPVCTGRILLFPSLVLVTDLGTTGLKQRVHIEKVLCMLMCLPIWDNTAALFKSLSARHSGHLAVWNTNYETTTAPVQICLNNFIFMSSSSHSLCFLSLSTVTCSIKAQCQKTLDKPWTKGQNWQLLSVALLMTDQMFNPRGFKIINRMGKQKKNTKFCFTKLFALIHCALIEPFSCGSSLIF